MYNNCIFLYTFNAVFLPSVSVKRTKLNRGQILAAVVEASGLSKEEAAARAGYSRSAYYKHIENPNLQYHILMAYGRAIRHDFTEEFPDMPKYELEDPKVFYGQTPATFEEAIRELEILRTKYMKLLEQYNEMILENMNRSEKGKKR